MLARNGFVISDRQKFPTFAYGYASIYADDLPVFVSADSILYAVHRSYDEILKQIEIASLRPALKTLLAGMRAALAAGALSRAGRRRPPRTSTSTWRSRSACSTAAAARRWRARPPTEIAALLAKANAAAGLAGDRPVRGAARRGLLAVQAARPLHRLARSCTSYFRAMMWLGRIDFRMHRDAARRHARSSGGASSTARWAWRTLVTAQLAPQLDKLDRTIEAFVGESDNMRVAEFPPLLARAGRGRRRRRPSALDDADDRGRDRGRQLRRASGSPATS